MDRFYPDVDTKVKIDAQSEKFKRAEGMSGRSMEKLTREKKQPGKF